MNKHDDKAKDFRKRAADMRAEAVAVADKIVRELLMDVAKEYEDMAAGREVLALTIPGRTDAKSM